MTEYPYILEARNVHVALPRALSILNDGYVVEPSRNGDVYVLPHPVITVYSRPQERVMFWGERDANPFLHFMEGLGFLGGCADVDFYATYAKQIRNYSDNGTTLPASYGHRWRGYWDFDQLAWAIKRLRADATDRRVVISMWNPDVDPIKADNNGKDVPCNTNIFFGVRNSGLEMMVNCRSNDIFWGCYGANAVHMSMMHEYIARSIGRKQGKYYQNSFNWHAYADFYKTVMEKRLPDVCTQSLRQAAEFDLTLESAIWDPYSSGTLGPTGVFPMMACHDPYARWPDHQRWDAELAIFLMGGSDQADGLTDPFFLRVAVPIRDAHAAYRDKKYDAAYAIILNCAAADWQRACREWFDRRAGQRAALQSVA